jgi:cell division protein FtsW
MMIDIQKKSSFARKDTEKSFRDQDKLMEIESPYRMSMPMMLITVVLICYGLIMLFSASMPIAYVRTDDPLFFILNQSKYTLIGIAIVIVISLIPIKVYDHIPFVFLAYVVALGLVIYTKFNGDVDSGSRRWIYIGSQSFQPSEVVKIALIFCLAGYRSFILRLRKNGRLTFKSARVQSYVDPIIDLVLPVLLVLTCLIFVFLQPHMSFFIIMLVLLFVCLLVSRISLKSWINGGLMLILIGLIAGNVLLAVTSFEQKQSMLGNYEHVLKRINIFSTLNEEEQEAEAAEEQEAKADENDVYQSKQSQIAIGSGGLFGVGFGNSRQKYSYLPEAHNDYVFAIICEELGFVGGVSIIVLFLAFFIGGISVALKSQNAFARIMCVGYTCLILIQAYFNIAVAVGVIPPTGITLPFFSYGGTANLFFLVAVGLILAISRTGVKRKKLTLVSS